jgi:hypothetical protein
MKEIQDYEKDIASIRTMMERSVKFISLSGLSGILAGVYALAGAAVCYYLLYYSNAFFGLRFQIVNDRLILQLLAIATVVLLASIGTGYWLSARKARKLGIRVWNKPSQQLVTDLLVPLATGGLFILILIDQGYFGIIAPACLIFYGLALSYAGRNTYREIQYLGFTEIILGLLSALLPGYGLLFWALGFGVMHIIYGAVMHFRYDQ